MSPGYTAVSYLDMGTVQEQDMMNVGLIFKNPTRTLFSTCDELKQDLGFLKLTTNDDVLRYMGLNSRDGFYSVLYGMATILFALIIIGSISLIYNAFAISVSERSKQFGMLKSVGATQKQVLRTVLFGRACDQWNRRSARDFSRDRGDCRHTSSFSALHVVNIEIRRCHPFTCIGTGGRSRGGAGHCNRFDLRCNTGSPGGSNVSHRSHPAG